MHADMVPRVVHAVVPAGQDTQLPLLHIWFCPQVCRQAPQLKISVAVSTHRTISPEPQAVDPTPQP